jgi:hypothetical protein
MRDGAEREDFLAWIPGILILSDSSAAEQQAIFVGTAA